MPLAGLEPAAWCLGDVSVQTLCRSAKVLVASDRGAKVISSAKDAARVNAYLPRLSSSPRTVAGRWPARPLERLIAAAPLVERVVDKQKWTWPSRSMATRFAPCASWVGVDVLADLNAWTVMCSASTA